MFTYTPEYFRRPTREFEYYLRGELRPDQLIVMQYAIGRVLSIGCGLGLLEHELAKSREVTGLDIADFRSHNGFKFIAGTLDQAPEDFDTLVFCESLEHIPEEEFERNWPRLKHGRLIISNWPDYHPLPTNNMDHIRALHDALFNRLAEGGKLIYRNGAQLVVDYQ